MKVKKMTPLVIVNMIFEALSKVPEVDKAIKDNWHKIGKIIHDKFVRMDIRDINS